MEIDEETRLGEVIDRENKKRDTAPKDDRIVKYLERRHGS
jgi:hypothetical protein